MMPLKAGETCSDRWKTDQDESQISHDTPARRTTPSWTKLINTTRRVQVRTVGSTQPGKVRSRRKQPKAIANRYQITGSLYFAVRRLTCQSQQGGLCACVKILQRLVENPLARHLPSHCHFRHS